MATVGFGNSRRVFRRPSDSGQVSARDAAPACPQAIVPVFAGPYGGSLPRRRCGSTQTAPAVDMVANVHGCAAAYTSRGANPAMGARLVQPLLCAEGSRIALFVAITAESPTRVAA